MRLVSRLILAWVVVSFTTGARGEGLPSALTIQRLEELERERGASNFQIWFARHGVPVEALLMIEVFDPLIADLKERGRHVVSTTVVFQYPKGLRYMHDGRRDFLERNPDFVVQELPIQSVQAIVVIVHEEPGAGARRRKEVRVVSFHDLTDAGEEGVSPRKPCWRVVRSTSR